MKAANKIFGFEKTDGAEEDKREEQQQGVDVGRVLVHLVVDTMVPWESRVIDCHICFRNQRHNGGSCFHTLDSPKHIRKIPVDH